jgi:hypothetical protein
MSLIGMFGFLVQLTRGTDPTRELAVVGIRPINPSALLESSPLESLSRFLFSSRK